MNGQVTVNTTRPNLSGVAMDASGAVYYLSYSSTNKVLKASASGSGYIETTALTSSHYYFSGNIAIDSSGDLFLITSGNVVKETPASGGTYTETTIPFMGTGGLTVDSAGNLYGTTSTGVVKLTPAGATYTSSTVVTGLNSPTGVAVDSDGNLYIAEPGAKRVLKETLSGGTYTQSVIASDLYNPQGIVVDGKGNLYFSSLNRIYKASPSGSGYSIRLFDYYTSGDPYWFALNADGTTLYSEGALNGGSFLVAYATSSVDPAHLAFGSVALGQNSTQTLTYTFTSANTLASYRVTTQGATGLDFSENGGGSCTSGASYAAGASCTVSVRFTPKYAGTRMGAVTLLDGSGAVIADAALSGVGTGPQIAITPATVSKILASSAYTGIAADGNGIVYLADNANKQVLKETPSGSGTYTESVVASGLLGPKGIAVDGAGNLYVTDYDSNASDWGLGVALKFTPQASGTYAQTTIATGLSFLGGIAVDSTGSLFVVDSGSSGTTVVRLSPLPGGGYSKGTIITNASCCGIAVDGAGTIYIAAVQNGVAKYTPGSMGDYTASSFSDGNVSTTGSVAVDGAGNVYIAGRSQGDNPAVSRVKDNGDGTYSISVSAGSGIITVDGSGAVYGIGSAYSAASGTVGGVYKAEQGVAPTLSFSPTAVGTTYFIPTATQWVNIGNVPLDFAIPTSGKNPVITTNFIVDSQSYSDGCPELTPTSSGVSLAPGQECRAFLNFAPTVAGPLTGTFTFTDNNLNVAGSTQVIHLSGTGTGTTSKTTPTLSWANPAPIALGTALSATQLNAVASVPGAYVYTPPAGTVLSAGPHTLSVTFTPTDTTLYNTATATVQITVTASSQTLTWATPAPIVYGTALSATQLNAVASVPGTYSYTPAAGAVLNAGTQTLKVTFTPTDTTTYTSATATVQLVVTQAVPAIQWAKPAAITVGTALSTTQLNATSAVAGSFLYTPSAGAVLPVGSQTLSVVLTPTDSVDYTTASASVTLVVNPSVLDFTFTSTGANYTTVIPGRSTSYTFALAPISGSYPGDVSFSVSGLPTGATFSFSPVTVAQSAGPQTETLRIQTAAQLAMQQPQERPNQTPLPLIATLLIPLSLTLRRRGSMANARRLLVLLAGVAGLAVCGMMSGCGTGNGFFGVAPKDYTITVTATSGSVQHAASVTLNLQ